MTKTKLETLHANVITEAKEILKIIKITMMMRKDTTFYTSILFSLKQFINFECDTAATDGKRLYINPLFFNDIDTEERIGLLAHEVMHVGFDHMHRCGNRNPKIWNFAADYVINNLLIKAGYSLPAGGLYDKKYDGKTVEEVYDIIYKKGKEALQKLIASTSGTWNGNDIQYPQDAKKGKEVKEEEVTRIIMQAQEAARSAGNPPGSYPGEVDIELKKIINPPLPWNVILQNFMTEYSKDDYSFRRPNRRFLPDHYLPTAHSEAIANIAFAVDGSSSVTDEQFLIFIQKIDEVMRIMSPKKVSVICFNTKLTGPAQELSGDENPFRKLKFKARGGTAINPVHEWVAEHKPTMMIIFTDGQFRQTPPIDKSVPLFWIINDNKKWESKVGGRVVHFETRK